MSDKAKLDVVQMDAMTEATKRANAKYPDDIVIDIPTNEIPQRIKELVRLVYQNSFLDGFNYGRNNTE